MKLPWNMLKNRKFVMVVMGTLGTLFLLRSIISVHLLGERDKRGSADLKTSDQRSSIKYNTHASFPGSASNQPAKSLIPEGDTQLGSQHQYVTQLDARRTSGTGSGQDMIRNNMPSASHVQQNSTVNGGRDSVQVLDSAQNGIIKNNRNRQSNNDTNSVGIDKTLVISKDVKAPNAEQQMLNTAKSPGELVIDNSSANKSDNVQNIKNNEGTQTVNQQKEEPKMIDSSGDGAKPTTSNPTAAGSKDMTNISKSISDDLSETNDTKGKGNVSSNGADVGVNPKPQDLEAGPTNVPVIPVGSCRDTQVVVCDEKAREKDDIAHFNLSERKAGPNPTIVERDGAKYYKFTPPVKINIVNLPGWMNNEYIHIKKGPLKDICIFDTGPITSETQIVGVVGPGLKEWQKPAQRWPGQIYVLMGWETPSHYYSAVGSGKSVWDGTFNSTMSYRVEADICHPYAQLFYRPKLPNQLPNYLEIAESKSKSIFWIVSNCRTESKREIYVEELKRYIDVDIIGKCGRPTPCPWSGHLDCIDKVARQFKFYLSFENSICTDYVTEKFSKVFAADKHIIPIVRGGAHYERLFPAKTFINTADFKSPQELAQFLKNMDNKMYSEYLAAKDMYQLQVNTDYILDDLCRSFTQRETKISNPDTKQWLDGRQCYKGNDYGWGTMALYYAKHPLGG